MRKVISKDGTPIAFDEYGSGDPIILVGGAFQHRQIDPGTAKLAEKLGQHFKVFHYDRRGRGGSGDTLPYAVEREVEDLDALIQEAGGSASLFGMSSGGALILETALRLGDKIKKLAIYEVPYNSESNARQAWNVYASELDAHLKANRRGDAAALFLSLVGMPADQVEGMRQSPAWPMFESVAPTLAYDAAVMGEESAVPTTRAASVDVPTLLIAGSATFPFMHDSAKALAEAIPNAEYRTLEGQTHNVDPEALVSVLDAFFRS